MAEADLGVTVGGDTLGHVLALGTNDGGAFTPDGIAAAVEKVHAQIRTLAKEIFDAEPEVDDSFYNDWSRFVLAFTQWKVSHSSWLSRAWNETRSELLEHVATFEGLRAQWIEAGHATKTLEFQVKEAPKGTLEDIGAQLGAALKHIGIGLAVVVGVPLVGYIAWRLVQK